MVSENKYSDDRTRVQSGWSDLSEIIELEDCTESVQKEKKKEKKHIKESVK